MHRIWPTRVVRRPPGCGRSSSRSSRSRPRTPCRPAAASSFRPRAVRHAAHPTVAGSGSRRRRRSSRSCSARSGCSSGRELRRSGPHRRARARRRATRPVPATAGSSTTTATSLATAVVLRDGTGYLTTDAAPAAAGRTYQLWGVDPQHDLARCDGTRSVDGGVPGCRPPAEPRDHDRGRGRRAGESRTSRRGRRPRLTRDTRRGVRDSPHALPSADAPRRTRCATHTCEVFPRFEERRMAIDDTRLRDLLEQSQDLHSDAMTTTRHELDELVETGHDTERRDDERWPPSRRRRAAAPHAARGPPDEAASSPPPVSAPRWSRSSPARHSPTRRWTCRCCRPRRRSRTWPSPPTTSRSRSTSSVAQAPTRS